MQSDSHALIKGVGSARSYATKGKPKKSELQRGYLSSSLGFDVFKVLF